MLIPAHGPNINPIARAAKRNRTRANGTMHSSIAAQLLVAQEAERRRVCREMHDDLAQRVALLQFEIEDMKRRFTSQPQVLPELDSLRGCVTMLAEDVHRICERLHPIVLDNLGLVRGIEFLCEEQARTGGLKASFVHGCIPRRLPANVSLCLYRVVQEALQNAAKYSGADQVTVRLHKEDNGVRALVSDTGRGFDMKAASRSGLGLMFLAERVKLLDGRCAIRSAPGKGTLISAWVPYRLLAR
jgi:signal transduction histidine kinase